ncbi:hypothetical protein LWC33_30810 [Pseudonocardia sp. RS11V-5]|uniref:hypothetical protein n=1 Tax=Pseudonocardia terrae TaxID=2905831 RepID=UPI001E3B0A75|nr:hypothetical protein [Pseudonocardia terrae]MCE3555822.1 hypothetical protein [Pseudonocardia terrae]
MRTTTRAALVGAAVLPLAVITPGLAFAGDAGYDGHSDKGGHTTEKSDKDDTADHGDHHKADQRSDDHRTDDHRKGDHDRHHKNGHHKKHAKHDNCCDGARGPAHDGPLGPSGLPRSPLPAPTGAPDVLGPIMNVLNPPAPTDQPTAEQPAVDPDNELSIQ